MLNFVDAQSFDLMLYLKEQNVVGQLLIYLFWSSVYQLFLLFELPLHLVALRDKCC